LNNALAIGEVAVIPIVSATPLFTLLMTFVYAGRETITWRTIAIALIVPGGNCGCTERGGGRIATEARQPQRSVHSAPVLWFAFVRVITVWQLQGFSTVSAKKR
jgi:drug/metabolite transporter (DMT)-like permease